MPTSPLPIDAHLPEIVRAVETHPISLLEAEPGAGKTTRVPAALLGAGFEEVCLLEPRPMAARHVAAEMAEEIGGMVGISRSIRRSLEQANKALVSH